MQIAKGKEKDYREWYNKNLDSYGHLVFTYAERWAEMLEAVIEKTEKEQPIEAIMTYAKRLSYEANEEEITRYMYGRAIGILTQYWVYGEELKQWNLAERARTEGIK